MIERYALYAVAFALALTGARLYWVEHTLSAERLDREREERAAWEERADALVSQQQAFDESLAREQRARLKAQQDFDRVSVQLETTRDLHEKLAESLRCYVNWLRNRASSAEARLSTTAGCVVSEGGTPVAKPADGSDERTRDQDGS